MSLSSYRTRRNATAAISRLSAEMLTAIFQLLAHEGTHSSWKWVHVTWVCSRWRSIALKCPSLWQRVSFMSSKWMGAYLTRAKPLPLRLDLQFFPAINEDRSYARRSRPLHRVLDLILHTQEMVFDCLDDDDSGAIRDFVQSLTIPAPFLEKLILCLELECDLPDNLFDNYFPQLRYVEFLNVSNFPWAPCHFRNLVDLTLGMSAGKVEPRRPTLLDVLNLLKHSQTLKYLCLSRYLPDVVEPFPRENVTLPHLDRMILNGASKDILGLINTLILPQSTTVELGLEQGPDNRTTFHGVFAALASQLGRDSKPPVDIEILCQEDDGQWVHGDFSIKIWHYAANGTLEAKPTLILCYDTNWDRATHRDLILQFFATFPSDLCSIRQLVMQTDDYSEGLDDGAIINQDDWLEMLKTHVEVRRISAGMTVGTSLCQALAPPLGALRGEAYQPTEGAPDLASAMASRKSFLPNLSSLILHDIDFGELIPRMGTLYALGTVLLMGLKARQIFGMVLDTLRLKRCTSKDWRWLEALRGVVCFVAGFDVDHTEQDKLDDIHRAPFER
ncbi:hypothetical protein BV25DRAFT_1823984 [Artomyces pyxidatus]|uniref:Uncharacterized protein n=1 Tax=Artomyces pyxidatus TaxID=48021 RepID=A0ACB8T577_9AGAM|nr:hypothetical protein BV25DRAFT_1823984 [Artomyces pyxidatus]